jgi:uncharacterized protein (DUF1501 family)
LRGFSRLVVSPTATDAHVKTVKAAAVKAGALSKTPDSQTMLKGLLKDHVRVTEKALALSVFPGSTDVKPMAGLTV